MSSSHVLRWVGGQSFVAAPVTGAPTLLRFDSDDFMDRLLATLADAPQTLPEFVAKPESWQQLAAPTPAPAVEAPKSAAAKALTRQRSLLGFKRETLPAPPPATMPLKLFQPVHQRFYVAAAHLVCELPGLPNRTTSSGDKSGMLLRRLLPKSAGGGEAAFVKVPGQPGRWYPVADAGQPLPGEEWLSVFPLTYTAPGGQPRKLLAGLVPAARHDDFRFAGVGTAPASPAADRAAELKALARMKIVAPWQGLIEKAQLARNAAEAAPGEKPWSVDATKLATATKLALIAANDQLQEASWRLLQDINEFFADVLPEVATGITAGSASRPAAAGVLARLGNARWGSAERARIDHDPTPQRPEPGELVLSPQVLALDADDATTLLAALQKLGPARGAASDELDRTELAFPAEPPNATASIWPGFSFPLAVATSGGALLGPFESWALPPQPPPPADIQERAQAQVALLLVDVEAAIDEALAVGKLGTASSQAPGAARMAAELAATLAADTGPPRYVLRFVHQRCDCGPLHPAVMSAPSEEFELAGFFDVDAPLRPIRIALPFDTSPGGLRKFGKNSAFIMSDLLCGQMKRVRRLGFGDLVLSVLPWPFHKDLSVPDGGPCGSGGTAPTFGTICSLSIPIITIVAFILLIVIATLLDLIFRWLPFLMVCFPVPGLKGKKP
jgi:hypothetical protein